MKALSFLAVTYLCFYHSIHCQQYIARDILRDILTLKAKMRLLLLIRNASSKEVNHYVLSNVAFL